MRAALIWARRATAASSFIATLGCALEPVEIARLDDAEGQSEDRGEEVRVETWDRAQLEAGVILELDLDADREFVSQGEIVRKVVIEIDPSPSSLPEGFVAEVWDANDQQVEGFESVEGGLRFEAKLKLGWRLELHSNTPTSFELRAKLISPS